MTPTEIILAITTAIAGLGGLVVTIFLLKFRAALLKAQADHEHASAIDATVETAGRLNLMLEARLDSLALQIRQSDIQQEAQSRQIDDLKERCRKLEQARLEDKKEFEEKLKVKQRDLDQTMRLLADTRIALEQLKQENHALKQRPPESEPPPTPGAPA